MVSFLKSISSILSAITADIPEGLKVIFNFIWKCRWFIVTGFVIFTLYTVVMTVLPYLMWMWVIKSIFGSLSFLFL